MELWIDAQLSPAIAAWINRQYEGIKASSVRSLGLRDANDLEIFEAARRQNAIIITKDADFVQLLNRFGPPPQIILISFGNSGNVRVKEILGKSLIKALELLANGEKIVELRDKL